MSTADTVEDVADTFTAGGWEFTPDVVAVFDDHVRASVPFYDAIQDAVAEVADWLAPAASTVVDLGASTGTTAAAIENRQPDRARRFYLYDTSPDMLTAARTKLAALGDRVTYVNRPIEQGLGHRDANLTLALFTLQFMSPLNRGHTLACARSAAATDGAILIAEKVRATDSRWAEIATEVSWDHKAEAGIGSDSIRAKARALRGVLRPQTEAANLTELANAGWIGATVLFRWHQWSLYGAFAN